MEETPRGWERKVSGVSMLEANMLLTALSLLSLFLVYDVSQRRRKCFGTVKYVQILLCLDDSHLYPPRMKRPVTGQTILNNITGKTNQYAQFIYGRNVCRVMGR